MHSLSLLDSPSSPSGFHFEAKTIFTEAQKWAVAFQFKLIVWLFIRNTKKKRSVDVDDPLPPMK